MFTKLLFTALITAISVFPVRANSSLPYTFSIPPSNTGLDILGPPYDSIFVDLNYPATGVYLTNWTVLMKLVNSQDYYGAASVYFQYDQPYDTYESVYEHSLKQTIAEKNDVEFYQRYNNLLTAVKTLGRYPLPSDAIPFIIPVTDNTTISKRDDRHCSWNHHALIDNCQLAIDGIEEHSYTFEKWKHSQFVNSAWGCYITVDLTDAEMVEFANASIIKRDAQQTLIHCANRQARDLGYTVSGFKLDEGNHLKVCVSDRGAGC
ncbi:hypothetical protein SJAG_04797 [Schizosaccharomyces japonicus yFS275]|uniref:WD-like domain-containing protein n=1 Tax=Schizosaccharomyces japonicus (strain yFS275 / FY16936) TaxID=402676 RepID=B6K7T0_SCHJY|nr:hypothetical protein SJAG_04797 [Schizosaccharomyces japonicus yFS275]EEB09584.1 hypothetical protein SJAG_04797 [Schizosaccharomyces japonicus yFS275]